MPSAWIHGRLGVARFTVALTCLLTLAAASAQRFVFVSTRAPEADFIAYDRPWQSEVFAYRDGSEIRLTRTPHASEYDPAPSPSGGLVAFLALDHADEGARDSWGWNLAVVEALTGREVATWRLPNTTGMTRPSGGFQPTWESEMALLVQVPSAGGAWEVHRFAVGEAGSTVVTEGFGVALQPGGRLLATERSDGTNLVDLATGVERHLAAGTPLAWWGDHLFVAQEGSLALVDVSVGAPLQLSTESGYFTELRVGSDRRLYAYIRLVDGGSSSELVVADENHRPVMRYEAEGWLSGLDWLADGRLVLAHEPLDGDVEILVLDLEGRGFAVNSSGVDHSPRAF